MDQLRNVLAYLKKYNFWVLSCAVLFAALGAWYSASGQFQREFNGFRTKIDQEYSAVSQIQGTPLHPNPEVIEGLKARTKKLRVEVYLLWKQLYDTQRKRVLKWPEALEPKFINHVERLQFGDTIPPDLCDTYLNYVRERFGELPAIVKAKPLKDDSRVPGTAPVPMRTEDNSKRRFGEEDYIVEWDDQLRIQRKFQWEKSPTPMQVWVAQEDLWVYENLLKIIKRTNDRKNATGPHNAVVSRIKSFEVGQEAALGGIAVRMVEGDNAVKAMSAQQDQLRALQEGGVLDGKALLNGRYVDPNDRPLATGDAATVSEFKRIPTRLVLQMDEEYITALVSECANATLPVEVDQVRINVKNAVSTKVTEEGRRNTEDWARKRPHVEVVIQGVIYIYNPPDLSKLNITEQDLAELADSPAADADSSDAAVPDAAVPDAAVPKPATDAADAEVVEEPAKAAG